MRKLFISFTGTMRAMAENRVSQEDLDNGLFFFGCARCHALHPEQHEINEVAWVARDHGDERAKEIHLQLVAAVLKAENEGRVTWRDETESDEDTRLGKLNQLLAVNGAPTLNPPPGYFNFSYPGVEELAQEQVPELLTVIH